MFCERNCELAVAACCFTLARSTRKPSAVFLIELVTGTCFPRTVARQRDVGEQWRLFRLVSLAGNSLRWVGVDRTHSANFMINLKGSCTIFWEIMVADSDRATTRPAADFRYQIIQCCNRKDFCVSTGQNGRTFAIA